MLSHEAVWAAIDALANAIRFRLRVLPAGRVWTRPPSTSRSGIPPTSPALAVDRIARQDHGGDGASVGDFFADRAPGGARGHLLPRPASSVPLIGIAQAEPAASSTMPGSPVGQGWDEVAFPAAPARAPMRSRSRATP